MTIKKLKKLSRRATNKIVTGTWGMQKYEIEDKSCQICGDVEDLQVHHEIYPKGSYRIKVAIYKKRIYYLCTKCHRDLHRGKILKLLEKYNNFKNQS